VYVFISQSVAFLLLYLLTFEMRHALRNGGYFTSAVIYAEFDSVNNSYSWKSPLEFLLCFRCWSNFVMEIWPMNLTTSLTPKLASPTSTDLDHFFLTTEVINESENSSIRTNLCLKLQKVDTQLEAYSAVALHHACFCHFKHY